MIKQLITVCVLAMALTACTNSNSSSPTPAPKPAPPSDSPNKDTSAPSASGNSAATSGSGSTTGSANSNSLAGIKVEDTKSSYEFVVKDPKKFLILLGDSSKFTVEGVIYDTRTLSPADRGIQSKTMCLGANLDHKQLAEADLTDKTFTVLSSQESVQNSTAGPVRTISFLFNELGLGLGCYNADSSQGFTWLEIQKSLDGIIEVKEVKQSAAPQAKVAADSQGYCTPEFNEAMKKMASESLDFAQKTLDLGIKILSATSEQDRLAYQREMTQEGRKIIAMCDDMERTWGDFSCKTKNDDGTDGPINNASDLKKSCDQARAQFRN